MAEIEGWQALALSLCVGRGCSTGSRVAGGHLLLWLLVMVVVGGGGAGASPETRTARAVATNNLAPV